jgi:3-phenylpropionate/trans-cinnamate dioxygenase ferredoxin reductase subunit
MADTPYVIVGGGLAAASAIDGIREVDPVGPVTLVTAERELPYHRPPLSKGFLAGKEGVDSVRVHEAAWYREQKVRVRLGVTARSVHIARQSVTLENGERIGYEKLLIATGSSARRLAVPGADLEGIRYLRTLADSYALRQALRPGTRAVMVGGGFIGMEVAATARHLGAQVTLLESGPVLYRAFGAPELSQLFRHILEAQGVTVRTGAKVIRFLAASGRLAGVVLDGGEQIPCDVAVVGVGSEPNAQWLAASGFSIDRGALIVNVRLETPAKNVWAAGDVTRFPDPVTKQPRRLEHWGNALAQGKQAGRNMAGANEPFTHTAAFFTDLFDITTNVVGDTDNPDQVTVRGTMDDAHPHITALFQRGGKLTGAVMVNLNSVDRSADFDLLERSVREGKLLES